MKTQAETNMWDPRERFCWAFRGMEFNGVPFLAPVEVFREWSEHLSKCGFIHVSQVEDGRELPVQEIHYQPPVRGEDHGLNGAGSWVPIEQPIQGSMVPLVEQLTPVERDMLIQDLRAGGYVD